MMFTHMYTPCLVDYGTQVCIAIAICDKDKPEVIVWIRSRNVKCHIL